MRSPRYCSGDPWSLSRRDDQIGNASGSGEPFSVGVEEELFLVDPISGRQANASTAIHDRFDGACPTETSPTRHMTGHRGEADPHRASREAIRTGPSQKPSGWLLRPNTKVQRPPTTGG
jgi:hypothetical protein